MNAGTMPPHRAGFTMIELLVALLVAAIVVGAAHRLLAGVLDAGDALRRSAVPPEGPTAARAWVLAACRSLEVGTMEGLGFDGTEHRAQFTARLLSADGWIERQPVSLAAVSRRIHLSIGGRSLSLADSLDDAEFAYLADPVAGGGWVTGWMSPSSAPLAIRLRWRRGEEVDSLLCPIGARG